jgi:uncharacterized SAM-dependent methyltransferase
VKSDLVSLQSQTVRIEELDLVIDFDENEAIHTEYSYKYSTDEIDALATAARVGHIDAEFERLANVLLGRGCGNPALITYPPLRP